MQSKENKNIDQLFKDRLQGMETSPPPVVWENIQAAMAQNKRDRKVIPLWWKLGGVAAALVVLFTVANLFTTDNPDNFIDDNQLVIDEHTKPSNELEQNNTNTIEQQEINKEHSISETQGIEDTSLASENKKDIVDDTIIENTSSTSKKSSITNNNSVNKTTIATTVTIPPGGINKDNAIGQQTEEKLIAKTTVATNNTNIIDKTTVEKKAQQTPLIKDDKVKTNEIITGTVKEGIANEDVIKPAEITENNSSLQKNDKSIFDAIEEQKEAVAKTTDELPIDRWSISPNVAPVYYSSLSQGSSIDPTFADNNQNGEVNVSYGINVSYALSPRLTVRSGVNNVNLSYATGGLELATGDTSAALQAILFNDTGTVITAVDQGALNNITEGSPFENLTRKATDGDVFLTQSISYTEIPTELTYALVNKKFGVNIIGGFSTLLLGNNEVSVSANNFEEVLGEANNLSDVSFSTNVGLGLSYQLSKKFRFNFEPTFKYQLNPYTDTSVQFRPYYVGVYSGLSLKF